MGRPWIVNEGRIQIGDDLRLDSIPVQSHLVTLKTGALIVGNSVRICQGAAIYCERSVRIGDRTSLGDFCVLADSDFHVPGDRDGAPPVSPVVIGSDVTLGSRVTVLRGATVGDGAWVAAGSVVSGNVEPGARVAGVPARLIGERWSAASANGSETLAQAVPAVVQQALYLQTRPGLETSRAEIASWDSLGVLTLLLALENAFGISLREEEMMRARSVRDLVAAVEAARLQAG